MRAAATAAKPIAPGWLKEPTFAVGSAEVAATELMEGELYVGVELLLEETTGTPEEDAAVGTEVYTGGTEGYTTGGTEVYTGATEVYTGGAEEYTTGGTEVYTGGELEYTTGGTEYVGASFEVGATTYVVV
jgi:hypothetical protein